MISSCRSARTLLAGATLPLLIATGPANAQFQDPNDSPGPASSAVTSSNSSARDQAPGSFEDFDGINVKVSRLIRMPDGDTVLKVALDVTETGDAIRRVALIQPQATLTDENGNLYIATETSGLKICSYRNPWDLDLVGCAGYGKDDLTRLTPELGTRLWLTFVPTESDFSAELATDATSASLQARFAYFTDDLSTSSYADIIIPGLTLP